MTCAPVAARLVAGADLTGTTSIEQTGSSDATDR
jgi:hypothetical protein